VNRVRAGGAAIAIALLVWLGGRWAAPRMLGLIGGIQQQGVIAPIVFVLLYAASVVFGLTRGVAYSFCGAVLGSTLAFLLGRHVVRRLVERRLASMPRFAAIDRAVSAKGRRIVFLLRLSPIVPFNFLNYALGVMKISTRDFVIASAGMLPGAVVYAYAGRVTREALALAGQAEVPKDTSYYAILVAGLAATLGACAVITRTARRALRDV
jgi:uncharacterized membrane protein YdjX (TVP38/TMEM64 family)